ncbi:DUF3106 domain-containing protein [Polaromonas sp.]|uniref:DUF3106 domain-containing protein n=1 Tax=Polaromonas sp. TaxID=1869339 RepID=UPI001857B1AC|nr:DUF3106 domain-containing protein [Polaromonas sp.]NMM06776.1 DUF3106 domain-containing protein [Polaromonas sp.]
MTAQVAFLDAQSHHDHTELLARGALQTGTLRLSQFFAAFALVGLLSVLPVSGFTQVIKQATSAAPSGRKPIEAASKGPTSRPSWLELSSRQQQALAPLASSWNTISEVQKRKWLEISKNYAALPLEGQTTMHSRMNEWVTLSHQQRAQARLNFGKSKELSKELTPEEKKAKWQTYQALSAEEKQKLAAKASPKPAGAATALRPVAPQKLAAVPPHSSASGARPSPKIAPFQPAIAPNSMVPHAGEMANGESGTATQR